MAVKPMPKEEFQTWFHKVLTDPGFQKELATDSMATLEKAGLVSGLPNETKAAFTKMQSDAAVGGSACGTCGVCGACILCEEINLGVGAAAAAAITGVT